MIDNFTTKEAKTHQISIFIAGSYKKAKDVLRKYCTDYPFCVTINKIDYVYSGGSEKGVVIGLINYPRFNKTTSELLARARIIGLLLMEELNQMTFTIQTPEKTIWYSRREEDLNK